MQGVYFFAPVGQGAGVFGVAIWRGKVGREYDHTVESACDLMSFA